MTTLEEIVTGAVGDLSQVFRDIAIAEDEIAKAQKRYPEQSNRVWEAFLMLRRPRYIKSDDLYRSHCRELLARVVDGADCRPGTKAEALAVLSEHSLVVKLNRTGTLVAARLMEETLGDLDGATELVQSLREISGREEYPGSVDESIEFIRRKISVADRVLKA